MRYTAHLASCFVPSIFGATRRQDREPVQPEHAVCRVPVLFWVHSFSLQRRLSELLQLRPLYSVKRLAFIRGMLWLEGSIVSGALFLRLMQEAWFLGTGVRRPATNILILGNATRDIGINMRTNSYQTLNKLLTMSLATKMGARCWCTVLLIRDRYEIGFRAKRTRAVPCNTIRPSSPVQ